VLLGLQSSIIERTLRDAKKQRAMLLARQILSAIEAQREPLPAQKTDGSFREVLEAVSSSVAASKERDSEESDYLAHLEVENINIPGVAENALRKITLTMSWGPHSVDQLTAVYFTQGD
jgi:hypothetical protein